LIAAGAAVTAEARSRCSAGPGFRLVDADLPAFELVAVEFLDRYGHGIGVGELDEGEAARPTGVAVGGQKHLDDVPDFREQDFEIAFYGFVIEVPNENLRADDVLLPVSGVLIGTLGARQQTSAPDVLAIRLAEQCAAESTAFASLPCRRFVDFATFLVRRESALRFG
jgi:hypothetical protein